MIESPYQGNKVRGCRSDNVPIMGHFTGVRSLVPGSVLQCFAGIDGIRGPCSICGVVIVLLQLFPHLLNVITKLVDD